MKNLIFSAVESRPQQFQEFNSFMTEADIIKKPVYWFAEQINGLVSIWYRPPSWKILMLHPKTEQIQKHAPENALQKRFFEEFRKFCRETSRN